MGGCLAFQKAPGVVIEQHLAVVGQQPSFGACDQPAPRVLDIPRVQGRHVLGQGLAGLRGLSPGLARGVCRALVLVAGGQRQQGQGQYGELSCQTHHFFQDRSIHRTAVAGASRTALTGAPPSGRPASGATRRRHTGGMRLAPDAPPGHRMPNSRARTSVLAQATAAASAMRLITASGVPAGT